MAVKLPSPGLEPNIGRRIFLLSEISSPITWSWVILVLSAFALILLAGLAWVLYRHGKRVGRLEARAAPKT